jgi:hypothetical protein
MQRLEAPIRVNHKFQTRQDRRPGVSAEIATHRKAASSQVQVRAYVTAMLDILA